MDKLAEIMDWKRREIAPLIRPVKDQDLENLGDRLRTEISFRNHYPMKMSFPLLLKLKENLPLPEILLKTFQLPNKQESMSTQMRTHFQF